MKTRSVPMQTRVASVRADTWNEEEKTVRVDWTTGAVVRRYDWWSDQEYDEELIVSKDAINAERLDTGAMAVLNSHRASRLEDQIGVVESWSIDEKARTASAVVRFSERDDVAGIVKDIRNKIIRNISVGYSIDRVEVDKTTSPPTYRATRWTPKEISFVPIGADGGARTRSQPQQDGTPCVFVEDDTMDKEEKGAADPNGQRAEQQLVATQPAPTPTAPPVDHSARAAEIVEIAAKHGFSERAAEWIRSNASLDQVRAAILASIAERDKQAGGHVNVRLVEDQQDKTRGAITQALLARGRGYDPDTKAPAKIDHSNEYRGLTLMDLARSCLDRAGVKHRGLDPRTVVARAFTQGTSDFPIILENTTHKSLLAGYAITPDTWSRFCATGSVTDFREHNRYGLGSLPNLLDLNEHGEYQNVAIPDGEKATISAGTKGYMVNLTREVIINDDMGALVGVPTMMGRAAARTIESGVYTYLASNPTVKGSALFSDARRNLFASGSTAPRNTQTAPTVTAVELMRQAMASQLDISGNDVLDLRPAIFVGNLAYGVEMRVVNEAQFDPTSGTKDTRPNTSRGLIRDIVETSRIKNNYWYFFADPNEVPTIEVAFLNGASAPFLDSEEGFTSDGVRMKVRLDFGIRAVDWRGAIRNDGA